MAQVGSTLGGKKVTPEDARPYPMTAPSVREVLDG